MNTDYLLGIPEIDAGHAKLFELSIQLEEIVKGSSLLSAVDIASELYDYVYTHLKHEEELIKGWSGASHHVAQHKALTHRLDNIFEKIMRPMFISTPLNAIEELQHLVVEWLTKHIKVDDSQFVTYLQAQGRLECTAMP